MIQNKNKVYFLLPAFFSLILTVLFSLVGSFNDSDQMFIDLYHVWSGKRSEALSTVIISIDNETINKYKEVPFIGFGPKYAEAIKMLREMKVKQIAVDMYLAISPYDWLKSYDSDGLLPYKLLNYDKEFLVSIQDGDVVLAATAGVSDSKNEAEQYPIANDYLKNLPSPRTWHIGNDLLYTDDDSVVRFFSYGAKYKNAKSIDDSIGWNFAARAFINTYGIESLGLQDHNDTQAFINEVERADRIISFCGPPGTIPRISMVKIIEGNISDKEKELLRGKIALIGITSNVFSDKHRTPYSRYTPWWRGYADMDGVEIQANIIETMYGNNVISNIPKLFLVVIWIPFAMIVLIVGYKYPSLHSTGIFDILLSVAVIALGWGLFEAGFIFKQSELFSFILYYWIFYNIIILFKKLTAKQSNIHAL